VTWLLRRLLGLWVRYQVRPEDVVERLREGSNPVCYVLEGRSFACPRRRASCARFFT